MLAIADQSSRELAQGINIAYANCCNKCNAGSDCMLEELTNSHDLEGSM